MKVIQAQPRFYVHDHPQVVDNVVAVVSSLLQWQPANVHVASSSR